MDGRKRLGCDQRLGLTLGVNLGVTLGVTPGLNLGLNLGLTPGLILDLKQDLVLGLLWRECQRGEGEARGGCRLYTSNIHK